jgi:hypothetical protein
MISSAILFYGPGAQQEAHEFALSKGRLLAPPFGEGGLKTDEARQIVSLLTSAPVGDRLGVVLVGPMDDANPKSSDVLLKSIEEFNGRIVCPVLWARDIGGVTSTIRSRCLAQWSYGQDTDEGVDEGRKLIHAWQGRDIPTLIEITKSLGTGDVLQVVSAVSRKIAGQERYSDLWVELRHVLRYPDVLPAEILVAFLKSMKIKK